MTSFSMMMDISQNATGMTTTLDRSSASRPVDPDEEAIFDPAEFQLLPPDLAIWKIMRPVYNDFYSVFIDGGDVTMILEKFEQVCHDALGLVRHLEVKCEGGNSNLRTLLATTSKQILNEKYAWRLLRIVIDENNRRNSDDRDEPMRAVDDQTVIDRLQLLMTWCEQMAMDEPARFNRLWTDPFIQRPSIWQNTLAERKRGKPGCDMDPDGPLHGQLHDNDAEDTRKLLIAIFALIRCGQFEKAIEICGRVGLPIYSAIIRGRQLFRDENLSKNDQRILSTSGNPQRKLWKRTCMMAADNRRLSQAERCLYAALCGKLHPVLDVAPKWDDRLWCYLNAAIENRIEMELVEWRKAKETKMAEEMLWEAEVGVADLSIRSIFDELATKTNSDTPYEAIYRSLALNDSEGVVVGMWEWLDERGDDDNAKQHLRFMAHVVLILRQHDYPVSNDLSNWILDRYVRFLSSNGLGRMVPFYASQLPPQSALDLVLSYMSTIDTTHDRSVLLQDAEASGFDVAQLCGLILSRTMSELSLFTGSGDSTINKQEEAMVIIGTLNWLVLPGSLTINEAVIKVNAIARTFLVHDMVDQAREAMDMVGRNAVDIVRAKWLKANRAQSTEQSADGVQLPQVLRDAEAEYRAFYAYLDACDAFNRWMRHIRSHRPPSPPRLQTMANLRPVGLKAQAEQELETNKARSERQKWLQISVMLAQEAVKALENILKYPNGFLFEEFSLQQETTLDTSDEERRRQQLHNLRSKCITQAVHMLFTLHLETKEYRRALALADLVADDRYRIYAVMNKRELHAFLQNVAACAQKLV